MAKFDAAAHARAEREKRERELPGASSAFQTKRTSRHLVRYFNRHLWKPFNVVSTQVDVLAAVQKHRNARVRVIADALGCAQSTLSRSLARLVMKGLVTMTIGTADKRQRWPKLTPAGEECLARAKKKIEEIPQRYIAAPTCLGVEMIKRFRADSVVVDRKIYEQIREEVFCEAGLPFWDKETYQKKWEGWTDEEILADHLAKPPPKKKKA